MNADPPRLLDPSSGASEATRAVLAAGRKVPPELPAESLAAMQSYVHALPEGAAAAAPWWIKGAYALAALGAVSGAAVMVAHRAPTPAPVVRAHVEAPVAPTPSPRTVTVPPPAAPPPAPPPVEVRPATARPAAPEDEAQRLEEARRVIERDPARALDILRALRHGGRRSHFREERDYLYTRALFRAGRAEEARAAAERFLRAHPAGIYTPSVRRMLDAAR